jgi:hypothetical protein
VRFVSPHFAWLKIAGFLACRSSLAALVALSLWSVFAAQHSYRSSEE